MFQQDWPRCKLNRMDRLHNAETRNIGRKEIFRPCLLYPKTKRVTCPRKRLEIRDCWRIRADGFKSLGVLTSRYVASGERDKLKRWIITKYRPMPFLAEEDRP